MAFHHAARATPGLVLVYVYLGILTLIIPFGAPYDGFIDIPLSFLLKNKLHYPALSLSLFRLTVAAPLYLAPVFGLVRDRYSPWGMKDRGFLIVFGALSTVSYVLASVMPSTATWLITVVSVTTASFLVIASAQIGLAAVIGKARDISGKVSSLWNVFSALPLLLGFWAGGARSGTFEKYSLSHATRSLFLGGACVTAMLTCYGFWRPSAVFGRQTVFRQETRQTGLSLFLRWIRFKPIYPAVLIWLLWTFAPGSATPLQYYLQDSLKASDATWGQFNALFTAGFIGPAALYALLCNVMTFRSRILLATIVGIPQFLPLAFVTTPTDALYAAFIMGMLGGLATSAYVELFIRCSPPGLEGATMMLTIALFQISHRFGDVLGTWLFESTHSFYVCVFAITLSYLCILPSLKLIPPSVLKLPLSEPS